MAIVFFDFDGTLVDEKNKIFLPTETTLKAIEQLQRNGHYAVLATGRAKCYVPPVGIRWDGIIASNGAYAEIAGRVVYNKLMPKSAIEAVIKRSDDIGYIYVLENQDVCYTNGFGNKEFMQALDELDISRENFRPIEEAEELRANKMFLSCDREGMFEEMCDAFKGTLVLGMHRSGASCDCDMEGNNKGIGIDRIAAAVGIPISDTYAFGDSINDYDMIKNVGHGIAMGDHRPELEKVCETVTAAVVDEGVAKGLKKYKLI